MNNYGNQFNQGNLQPMQQPTYGYGQNAPYPAPMPTRKPADKNRVINIVMTALGGVTAFFALINLINCIVIYSDYDYYKLSFFASPLLFLLLGASLVMLSVEKLIDPKKQGQNPGARMALYIIALALAAIAAIFGLLSLYDNGRGVIESLDFDGEVILSRLSYLSTPIYSLTGCAAVAITFIPRLMEVIKQRNAMQYQRQPMQQPYVPFQPNVQPQQYVQPQQPKDVDTKN